MSHSWDELRELVLKEMDRLNEAMIKVTEEQMQLRIDVAMLKVKSGVWGFLAGLLPALGLLIYFVVKNIK